MVKWINAQNPDSSIGNAIAAAAQTMYGDTLTPALKREQLRKAQRENAGVEGLMSAFGALGNAGAGYTRPGAPGATSGASGPAVSGAPSTAAMFDPNSPEAIGAETMLTLGHPQNIDMTGVTPAAQGAWGNLSTTWGRPLKVNSAYRTPEHNADVGGAKDSQHTHGNAFDVDVSGMSQEDRLRLIAEAKASGFQGVGVYDNALHFDVGPERSWGADYTRNSVPAWATDAISGAFLPPATDTPMTGAPATGPGEYNPLNPGQLYGELAQRTIEAGGDPQKTADMVRMMMAGMFGAENQATTDAFVGAGGNYSNTYSGFSADQNRQERDSVRDSATTQRGQDLSYDANIYSTDTGAATDRRGQDMDFGLGVYKDQNDMVTVIRDGVPMQVRKAEMLPTDQAVISDAENKGLVARGMEMTPAQKEAYVGADATKDRKATWVRTPAGTTVPTIDGRTNANTGEVLPDGTLPVTGSGSMADLGLDKLNARDAQSQVLAGKQFKGTLARARDVATKAGPTAFGIIGRARSLGQDVQAAVNAGAEAFGGGIEQSVKETESSLRDLAASDPVAASFFNSQYDPNLTSLEMYARLLPYEAAMAIAGQEGRGLSDSDVKRFQAIVGDPLSFFGSQQAFLTTLDMIEAETDARISANQKALTEGKSGVLEPVAPGTPAMQGAEPKQITTDAEYDSLPSGTEFIAPDGSRRRKP